MEGEENLIADSSPTPFTFLKDGKEMTEDQGMIVAISTEITMNPFPNPCNTLPIGHPAETTRSNASRLYVCVFFRGFPLLKKAEYPIGTPTSLTP